MVSPAIRRRLVSGSSARMRAAARRNGVRGWGMIHRPLHRGWTAELHAGDAPEALRGRPLPATVPGCIHSDLLAADLIPDPFYRDNEHAVMWIGEAEWIYRRTFDVPAQFLDKSRILLRCAGLTRIVGEALMRVGLDLVAIQTVLVGAYPEHTG